MLHLAVVHAVVAERHGVMVAFRDLTSTAHPGRYEPGFVRVLVPHAHPTGGAVVDLPEVGELGVVAELDGGFLVWLGSLHWQVHHQIDPERDLELHRHPSGVLARIRGNGDAEWRHPSGLRVTVSRDGHPLPDPKRTGVGFQPDAVVPHLVLEHPTAGRLRMTPDGDVALEHPAGGKVTISPDGDLAFAGFKTTHFEGAARRFVMENLLDWLKGHTHTSGGPGAPTSPPAQAGSLTPDTYCTPDTFLGP